MAARKAKSLWRGIIVALGCVSAVWMIFYNCERIATYIKTFIANNLNIFDYFFNGKLAFFASLFVGISFFAIIIRDLWALKKLLLWISIVFSVLCFIAVLINGFILPITNGTLITNITLFGNVAQMLQMVAYVIFAVVGINSKRHQPFAFYFGIFAFLLQLILNVIVLFDFNGSPDFNLFIPYITIFATQFFVFKCALYE